MDRKTKLEKCKSFFHSFTPYQIGYLATVLVLAAVVTIFFPEMMLESTGGVFLITCSVINVIANPVCELLIAKQSKWNFIVDLVFIEGTYVALALALGWYTLAMTCIFFWIPIDIISFVRWSKYPDAQDENPADGAQRPAANNPPGWARLPLWVRRRPESGHILPGGHYPDNSEALLQGWSLQPPHGAL